MTDKIKDTLEQLDLTDIAYAMSQIALKLISGVKLETVEHTIKLAVPKEIATILDLLAEKTGLEADAFYSKLASEGLASYLQIALEKMASKQKVSPDVAPQENPLSNLGIDMSKITEGMSKLGGIAKQLADMQKVVESVSPRTDKKDPE